MKKITILAAALLVAIASPAFAGGGNVLASGTIDLPASATPSTNTATIGIYGSGLNSGLEWGKVYAVVVRNGSDFSTTTTVARADLGDTTTLVTAVAASNASTYAAATLYGSTVNSQIVYSGTNDVILRTNSVTTYYPIPPPCAKELLVTVTMPTNDAAKKLDYLIYGE